MRALFAAVALSLPGAALADQLVINVPSLQEAPPKPAAQPKEKIICKSDVAIGSLVRRNRWCATAAEWRQSERSAKTFTDTIQRDKGRFDGDPSTTQGAYLTPNGIRFGGN